ncbi:MAG: phage tail sheath family protein [Planctomycetota bacterium]|nr:MAG: phage tail sheath family protein [Planctomycetota bacterium]
MPDYLVGMNVIETDGTATSAIVGAATSVAGFLVDSERGPINTPIKINSWSDFLKAFGGHRKGWVGSFAVEGFFLNGGSEAYVVRPAKEGDLAAKGKCAKVTIGDTGGAAVGKDKKLPKVDENAAKKKPSLTFFAGYHGEANPGTWANNMVLRITRGNTETTPDGKVYDLINIDIGIVKDGVVRFLESHPGLAPKDIELKLRLNSKLLAVDKDGFNPPQTWDQWLKAKNVITDGKKIEEIDKNLIGLDKTYDPSDDGIFVRLSDGADLTVKPMLGKEGFKFFDRVDIQMLASPDGEYISRDPEGEWKMAKQFIMEGRNYCFRRGDCMFVASIPHTLGSNDITKVISKTEGLRTGDRLGSYAALYAPYVDVADPDSPGDLITIPPTGHILGVYARIDMQRGVWKAPAGDEASLMGVMGLRHRYTDREHTNLVRKAHINCVRFVPGAGIVVDSSRTLSTKTIWWYVNVRRLFNYVKTSLKNGLRWVRQEPNKKELWDTVKFNSVKPFMMNLWKQGAFGEGAPEEVFTIKCDADNNPPYLVDQGIFTLEVYMYPSKPAETVVIIVGQQDAGGSAGEA